MQSVECVSRLSSYEILSLAWDMFAYCRTMVVTVVVVVVVRGDDNTVVLRAVSHHRKAQRRSDAPVGRAPSVRRSFGYYWRGCLCFRSGERRASRKRIVAVARERRHDRIRVRGDDCGCGGIFLHVVHIVSSATMHFRSLPIVRLRIDLTVPSTLHGRNYNWSNHFVVVGVRKDCAG